MPLRLLSVLSVVAAAAAAASDEPSARPHLVLFVIDDLGYSDLDTTKFGEASSWSTPAFSASIESGTTLSRYYTQTLCSPARAALMTGRYPSSNGLAAGIVMNGNTMALPTSATTLGTALQERGYATHLVGKWNLGSHSPDLLPTARGFTSFVGQFGCAATHVDHIVNGQGMGITAAACADDYSTETPCAIDLNNGTEPLTPDGRHSDDCTLRRRCAS